MLHVPCVILSHSHQYFGRSRAGPYFDGVFLSLKSSQFMQRDLLTGIPQIHDSLLALHWILFLNYDFHHFSKNRGWLWNNHVGSSLLHKLHITHPVQALRFQLPHWCLARPGLGCWEGVSFCERPWEGGFFQQLCPAGVRRSASLPQQSEATTKLSYADSWFAEHGFLVKSRSKSLVK